MTPRLAYGMLVLQPTAQGAAGSQSLGGTHQALFMPQTGSAAYKVGNLTSHGGPVMHSAANHLIFWLPPGFNFDNPVIDRGYANASNANYEALIERYFRDISGTEYYYILQQYTDSSGAPGVATTLAGSWVDVSPYPSSEGSRANPLQDSDLENEVAKAITVNGWSSGNGNSEFFVFTGYNVFGCAGNTCSYNGYCAYHSAYSDANGQSVIYADLPDPGSQDVGSCLATDVSGVKAPNGSPFADSVINLVAHEEFESVTDPIFNGWYYQDTDHEVGDECVWRLGSVALDGSNISLNGHKYLVQEMWSDKIGGCFLPTSVPTLRVVASYQVVGGGSGFTPPTFTFFSNHALVNKLLSDVPQTLTLDPGTPWNVTSMLSGSSSGERWQSSQATAGVLQNGGAFVFTYYHQFLVTFRYGVAGGGVGYSAPALTVAQFGSKVSMTPTAAGLTAWVDAQSKYSYPSELPGSTSSERWFAPSGSGTVSSATIFLLGYYHQYFLSVQGGSAQSAWYDSNAEATVTTMGVYGRGMGSGLRVTGSQLDGESLQSVSPTTGPVSVVVQMNQPHALVFTTVAQYQVSLDSGAPGALMSITPPTLSGDNYWYDSSSNVTLMLNGVWGRDSSSGNRLLSYAVDGGAVVNLDTTGQVTVLRSSRIAFPQSVTTTSVIQYKLLTGGGSIQSVTNPSVLGDAGWYDSGTGVGLSYNYVWNVTQDSRFVALEIKVDGVESQLARSGIGTFQEAVTMTRSHALDLVSVTQYRLVVSGGFGVVVSPQSPTKDAFYDSGSSVSVSSAHTWNGTALAREALVSYSLDGGSANPVPDVDLGGFTVPPLTLDGPHHLVFDSAKQYLVTFGVTDASGATRVVPTLLEIDTTRPSGTVDVQGSKAWLAAGSSFAVGQLLWEHVDVKPLNQAVTVNAPQNVTIAARIYPVTLKVTDYLHVPISGATAKIELVNGTLSTRTTASDGSVSMPLVPLGRLNGTVSYLGISRAIAVDAAVAQHNQVEVMLLVSGPDFGASAGGVVAVVFISYMVLRRRRKLRGSP